jgi:hypothetical protein
MLADRSRLRQNFPQGAAEREPATLSVDFELDGRGPRAGLRGNRGVGSAPDARRDGPLDGAPDEVATREARSRLVAHGHLLERGE